MIPIHTKKLNKKWFCFATFDGYDYSYVGNTKEQAQDKMKKRLKKNSLDGHALFMEDEIIQPPPKENKPPVTYQRDRIDSKDNIV